MPKLLNPPKHSSQPPCMCDECRERYRLQKAREEEEKLASEARWEAYKEHHTDPNYEYRMARWPVSDDERD